MSTPFLSIQDLSKVYTSGNKKVKALDMVSLTINKGEVFGFSKMRSAPIMRQLYGFGPWIGQIFYSQLQSDEIDLTLMDFPSAAAVLPYMHDFFAYLEVLALVENVAWHRAAEKLMPNT